jgi:cytochrome c553
MPCWRYTVVISLILAAAALRADEPDPAGIEFFEKKIRPVLVEHCYECHSATSEKLKGELRLDTRAGMMKGGESGAIVAPGKVDESLLIQALRYQGTEMPPKGKLPKEVIADFEQWVKLGLPDPREGEAKPAGRTIDFAAGRKFWAFRPIASPALPAVKNAEWAKNEIDRFILAKLEEAGLAPSKPAERAALLRRASFDLIGLPPTPEEVEAFLNDTSPNAFERVVDRLLASQHYGERWGRHWLDVARFGEDQAHTFQARMYPQAFRYRDWVVSSLNRDLPYDQFLIAQIAGDQLDDHSGLSKGDRAAALGLFALGPVYYADNNAAKQAQADEWDDRVDTLTRGVLGLTVACARCHDHKFDPISNRDYYALAGIFASTKYQEFSLASAEEQAKKAAADEAVKGQQKQIDDYLDGEAKAVRPELAKQTAAYLVASWKHLNKRKVDAKFATSETAKQEKLQEQLLKRWFEYLTNGPGKDQPRLAEWRELIAKQDAAMDLSGNEEALTAVRAAAEKLQQQVVELLASDKVATEGSDEDKKFYEQLAGNKGVLTLPRNEVNPFLSDASKQELKKRQDELNRLKKEADSIKLPVAHSIVDGPAQDLRVFVQGNPAKQGDLVPRGFLTVLQPAEPMSIDSSHSGRLEIAKAIASPANPLTARVAVNRVWQGHFGQGLVRTPSNFGALGERPTHPELLDYLAKSFIDSGWSLKKLHRQIMLSATYQQSASADASALEKDPDNKLLGRMNRRRLEVEPWRDAMLAASGTLDATLGGPSANLADSNFRRRTLYGYISRHQLNELLRLFDFPDPNITSDRRTSTTVPLQQLFVLNSDFLGQQAKALAERVKKDAGESASDADKIRRLYLLTFGRAPTAKETELGQAFLAAPVTGSMNAWEEYTLALLGSNEFAFVD